MINNEIQCISYEEALDVYERTIAKSGGGFSGVRDECDSDNKWKTNMIG